MVSGYNNPEKEEEAMKPKSPQSPESVVREIKRKTRRKFNAEKKIRLLIIFLLSSGYRKPYCINPDSTREPYSCQVPREDFRLRKEPAKKSRRPSIGIRRLHSY